MRRHFFGTLFAIGVSLSAVHPGSALAQCPGTSGSAVIGGIPWTADCVFAATVPDCVDSTGSEYECFQVFGSSETSPLYGVVALFFAQPPSQGQTYALGGASPNGAMVIGEAGFWVTADAPYTGSVTVTVYNANSIECTFAFDATSLFFGADLALTNGVFVGTLLPVEASTWTDVKSLYR